MWWTVLLLAVTAHFLCVAGWETEKFVTEAFTLVLEKHSQTATELISHAGFHAGSTNFSLLLPIINKTIEGYLGLGDLQLRLRPQTNKPVAWIDIATHQKRKIVVKKNGRGLSSADITPSLNTRLPLRIQRTWKTDGDSLILSYEIENIDKDQSYELGGVGIPLPFNNDWSSPPEDDSVARAIWTGYVASDPAPALDAGYVVTNRLNGAAPTLLAVPFGKTPLEQWRLNSDSDDATRSADEEYPIQWHDRRERGIKFEGIFSWWSLTRGVVDADEARAKRLGFQRQASENKPTSVLLASGQSLSFGLRLFTAAGPRAIEQRLRDKDRPSIVGVPGFVVSQRHNISLLINSTSAVSIVDVFPPVLTFTLTQPAEGGLHHFVGTVDANAFGLVRVTFRLGDNQTGTAHYTVIRSHEEQLQTMSHFRFEHQWYDNRTDYFKRAPSVIAFDHSRMLQVLDEERSYIAGLSDEAGAGSYLSAVAKQYALPVKDEIAKLEAFIQNTLWMHLQDPNPSSPTYGSVKKSLFYYDHHLRNVGYDPSIVRSSLSWNKSESYALDRSYNYMHPLTVYWIMYRLARDYDGLTMQPWTWYLDRAYDTIAAMEKHAGFDAYASYGLMEGSYMANTLSDLKQEGRLNATLSHRAHRLEQFMKKRADGWQNTSYPLGSEATWDSTGQEEVYVWTRYFGHLARMNETAETVVGLTSTLPHWGFSGTSKDYWDFWYSGKGDAGARLERMLHHYKGAQASFVLLEYFLSRPQDVHVLRAGYAGLIGTMSSILEDGFGSTGFHSRPDYWNWDPLSGDTGTSIAMYMQSARSVVLNHVSVGGWAGFGAEVNLDGEKLHIVPQDGLRQRLFVAPIGLYVTLRTGKIQSATYDISSHDLDLTLDPATEYVPCAKLEVTTTAWTEAAALYKVQSASGNEPGVAVIKLAARAPTAIKLLRSVE